MGIEPFLKRFQTLLYHLTHRIYLSPQLNPYTTVRKIYIQIVLNFCVGGSSVQEVSKINNTGTNDNKKAFIYLETVF